MFMMRGMVEELKDLIVYHADLRDKAIEQGKTALAEEHEEHRKWCEAKHKEWVEAKQHPKRDEINKQWIEATQHPKKEAPATTTTETNEGTFHGYDFDPTMLRIGSMNMLLHSVENPDIRYKDSLAQTDDDDAEKYSLILANPPFAGSLDYESTARDLQQIVKTKKTELLFLALFLRLLQTGGRAASSKAHKTLRHMLVEDQKLDAVISMPSGVFRPYAGVSTAILLFTKTNSGGTDDVWFYDMQADGFSLDDKRTEQPDKSDLPDILTRWQNRNDEANRQRTDQSFLVPKADIAENNYDLSLNRYKEVIYEAVEHDPPQVILQRLAKLEEEISISQHRAIVMATSFGAPIPGL